MVLSIYLTVHYHRCYQVQSKWPELASHSKLIFAPETLNQALVIPCVVVTISVKGRLDIVIRVYLRRQPTLES